MRTKIPYYLRDSYTLNNYLIFDNKKLKIFMTGKTIKFRMYSNFHEQFDNLKVEYTSDYNVLLHIGFDRFIKTDGYQLDILKNKNVYIKASNERGVRYAITQLMDLITTKDNKTYLPIIKISDSPSFKLRGIIEGFYGNPWSFDNRIDMIKFMNKHRLNAYFYAPKDDEYHRNKWRELYPEEDVLNIVKYYDECEKYNIDFYYSISPGKDFDYTQEEEFQKLYKKLDQVVNLGIRKYALLFDDIEYNLDQKTKKFYQRPGVAHALISNKVYEYLENKVIDLDFYMCPTEYKQNFDTMYRHDLDQYMNKDVAIFWTGENVVPEVIENESAKDVKASFNSKVVLWENYPVNDFLESRIFLSPILNRGTMLNKYLEGVVINPMSLWNSSKIGVISLSHYLWNSEKYDPEKSFIEATNELVPCEYQESLKVFAESNYQGVLTSYNDQILKDLVNKEDYTSLLEYYKVLKEAVDKLRTLDNELTNEFKPWFHRVNLEFDFITELEANSLSEKTLDDLVNSEKVLGIMIVDYLIEKLNLVSTEQMEKIKKLRGTYWWKAWEDNSLL